MRPYAVRPTGRACAELPPVDLTCRRRRRRRRRRPPLTDLRRDRAEAFRHSRFFS